MKLNACFDYKRLAGLAKFRLERKPSDLKLASLSAIVNGVEMPLKIDPTFLDANGVVEFAVNTHAVSGKSLSLQVLATDEQGRVEKSDPTHFEIDNDPNIAGHMKSIGFELPVFVGLPIDSTYFRRRATEFEYPTAFNDDDCSTEHRRFRERGWVIARGVIGDDLLRRVELQLDQACADGYAGYVEGESTRLEHLHTIDGPIKELFDSRALREFLAHLYGVAMVPCQTLSYRYGSQQSVHSDFVHLSVYPENLMCGVWVALEDVREGSGELVVYSSSHRSPKLTTADLDVPKVKGRDYSRLGDAADKQWKHYLEEHNLQPTTMRIKRGDLIVWDANLLHAGSPRTNPSLTRKSVVLHYFGKGSYSYFDAIGEVGISAELN